jgi:superfamily II DNA helicase RecQ
MRVKVVTLRYASSLGGFDERPLSDFVRDKEVLAVREHFFTVHDLPHLACLITYQPSTVPAASPAPTENGTQKRKGRSQGNLDALLSELTEAERTLFGTLREWRAARARKDGVPPYVVFTNKELLAVVKAKPQTPNALGSLEGIGPGKVERYGNALLGRLNGRPTEAAPATREATA